MRTGELSFEFLLTDSSSFFIFLFLLPISFQPDTMHIKCPQIVTKNNIESKV